MTALFAPAAARETLFTLYAFNHEIARAREVASDPMLALIRLQWWREVVQGAARAHEVATPLRDALAEGRLDAQALEEMIAAREAEAEESLDELAWEAYVAGAGGALMRAAGVALEEKARGSTPGPRLGAAPPDPHTLEGVPTAEGVSSSVCGSGGAAPSRGFGGETPDLLSQAGAACAAVGLLRNRAAHAALGRWSFPQGRDAAWVADWAGIRLAPYHHWPASVIPAALPLVLARRHLQRQAESPDPWARLSIWAAARRGWF